LERRGIARIERHRERGWLGSRDVRESVGRPVLAR
jgi:hypothetical protein